MKLRNENLVRTAEQDKISEIIGLSSCPECKNSTLSFSPDQQKIYCNNCKTTFPVKGDIPVFLPENQEMKSDGTGIHGIYGTIFNYGDHYKKDALEFDYFEERSKPTAHIERRLREFAASKITGRSGKILDVGCGSAWTAEHFCQKGFSVYSLDISVTNVEKAMGKYPWQNHYGVVADAFHLPFLDCTFDYVISTEVIEHVPDPGRFIESVFRVIKPGGKLIVTTPYKEKIIYSLCVHCNRMTPLHAHLHSFDENILRKIYTGDDLKSFTTEVSGSKILVHLRTHILLRFLGFTAWKLIDRCFNSIYRAPLYILACWQKKL